MPCTDEVAKQPLSADLIKELIAYLQYSSGYKPQTPGHLQRPVETER